MYLPPSYSRENGIRFASVTSEEIIQLIVCGVYYISVTLVPDVFLDISPHKRAAREPRSGEHESQSGEKEKPLVTLDLNLTFMQTPAVKRVNLIIQKGTNGSLAITCLSAANVSTRVVRSGIFWPTWPGSMCVFARMFSSATIAKVNCFAKHISMQASPLFVL